jgi:flagellin
MAQADFSRISTNIAALNTLNSLRLINGKLGTSQLRLATGKRINQASDDPAGLTIALKMLGRSEGLKAALGNIGDAKNMLAVAESGLGQISEILIEMKAKATAAATETLGTEERGAIKSQMESLGKQINDIVSETQWNSEGLLGGEVTKALQTGAGASDQTTWNLQQNHSATEASGLGLGTSSNSITSVKDTVTGTSFDTGVGDSNGVVVGADDSAWLSELSSGKYEFEVEDKATDATHGKATTLATGTDWSTVALSNSAGAPTGELASSGVYSLKVIDKTAATFKFELRDEYGTLVHKSDAGGQNLGAVATDVKNEAETATLGFTLDGATVAAFTDGSTYDFEYIKVNQAKVKLSEVTGSGASETTTTVAVDANGVDGTSDPTRNSFYVAAAATYDTGRGFTVKMAAWGSINVAESTRFDLTEAGAVSMTLASATDANTLMDTIDAALTKVTGSLNGVGSLVARLDKKEQAVSVSQVNTEAAYNRIMNADMAYEQVQASKYQILQQTAMAMLSQANMAPQGILSLFR